MFWLFRAGALQDKALPTNQLTTANEEDLDIGPVFITGEGNYILLTSHRGGDSLTFNNPVYGLDLVSEQGCLFKIQRLSRFFHLALKPTDYRFLLPLEEEDYLFYHLSVFLLAHHPDTGSGAVVDVIIEAGPRVTAGDGPGTGTEWEDSFEHFQRLPH